MDAGELQRHRCSPPWSPASMRDDVWPVVRVIHRPRRRLVHTLSRRRVFSSVPRPKQPTLSAHMRAVRSGQGSTMRLPSPGRRSPTPNSHRAPQRACKPGLRPSKKASHSSITSSLCRGTASTSPDGRPASHRRGRGPTGCEVVDTSSRVSTVPGQGGGFWFGRQYLCW